jgi:hypothetical protein
MLDYPDNTPQCKGKNNLICTSHSQVHPSDESDQDELVERQFSAGQGVIGFGGQ